MRFLNITNDEQKITAFYSFYKKYFPPQERDTLHNMKALAQKSVSIPGWTYVIQEVMDKDEPVGGLIYDWFSDINVLIIEFVFIAKAYRHHRIAQRLIERLIHKIPDITILIEVEKESPAKEFWRKIGFSALRTPYIQPPISKDQKAFDGLMLMSNKPVKNLKNILHNHYWKYAFLN